MTEAARDILSFWFDEIDKKLWFVSTDAFDARIRQKFEGLAVTLRAEMTGRPHKWEAELDAHFALIIALDQFPRNMYRGTAASFAWDAHALQAAQRFVDKGWDLKLPQSRRAFAYMPFMHAEDIKAQAECVRLVDSRLDDNNTLFHAKAHQKMIEAFGRFPHRNAVLGRENTPQEIAYIKDGGYSP